MTVPSSTSSSSHRAPATPKRSLALTLTVFASLLGGWEALLRHMQYRPAITDSPALWTFERLRGDAEGERAVWFLGKSRIFNAIDPKVLHKALPERTGIQLAVPGTSAVATLLDMAKTGDARGIVVCSVTAHELSPGSRSDQAKYVEAYHGKAQLNEITNAVLGAFAQEHLVSLAASSHVRTFAAHLLRYSALPPQWHARQRFVRWRGADFFGPGVDLEAVRQRAFTRWKARLKREPPPPPEVWFHGLEPIRKAVRELQRRGTKVLFLRMPTTGPWWAFDQRTYPRNLYWDRFAATMPAVSIHFQDEPLLRTFECPDHSHIDKRDRPRFTRALIEILRREGLLDALSPPPNAPQTTERPSPQRS